MVFELIDYQLAGCLFLGAVLFTSVGHGGASAYIALMALFGIEQSVFRPTALVLNILVTSFSSFRYIGAKLFDWKVLWPVLLGAVPMAFLGGSIQLPGNFYKPLVAFVLFVSAIRLFWPNMIQALPDTKAMPVWLGVLSGAAIGLLAGLTGTGGGIFLSPLLIFTGWSDIRRASGITSVFILCNSLAGLAGNYTSIGAIQQETWLYAVAVLCGAIIGTYLGISAFAKTAILRALGVVLLIAAAKLVGIY
ncbi:MAG: sulfite exporter TauE/SafE family protein [Rhizobiaceae bacterium]